MNETWPRPDHPALDDDEWQLLLDHFAPFPWDELNSEAIGLDLGCGDGRFAAAMSLRSARLYCLEPEEQLLKLAEETVSMKDRCGFVQAPLDSLPFEDESLDFVYSIGALSRSEEPTRCLVECARVLRPGAPILAYFLYALDNRPAWYKAAWKASDRLRELLSSTREPARTMLIKAVTLGGYYPLARASLALEQLGVDVRRIPLSAYKRATLETMGAKAAERFTRESEPRYQAEMIRALLDGAGFERIELSSEEPLWTVVARKKSQ